MLLTDYLGLHFFQSRLPEHPYAIVFLNSNPSVHAVDLSRKESIEVQKRQKINSGSFLSMVVIKIAFSGLVTEADFLISDHQIEISGFGNIFQFCIYKSQICGCERK